jgi:hypothetical protein
MKTIRTRDLANKLAAERGIGLDAAQRVAASIAKRLRDKKPSIDEATLDKAARELAAKKGITLEAARAAIGRVMDGGEEDLHGLGDTSGKAVAVTLRSLAQRIARERGLTLDQAQRVAQGMIAKASAASSR